MTKEEQNFNKWFDEYADGVKVFEETDMKMAYLQGTEELKQAKKELKEQLKSYEGYINDIPLVIDPCKICKNHSEEKGYAEKCSSCSWFYPSNFEIKVKE